MLQGPGSGQEVREGFSEEVTLQLRLKSRSYPRVLDSVSLSFQITLFPPLGQGCPTSRLQTSTSCQISCSTRLEIKGTINIMPFNHPDTMPTARSMEKLSSTKLDPGAKKFGDLCSRSLTSMDNIHLVPLLADILFILANGRHHQETGEKKDEVVCFHSRLLPVGCALLVCFPSPEAAGFGKGSCASHFRPRVAAVFLSPNPNVSLSFSGCPITQQYSFLMAALTKYHKLDGLKQQVYCLTVLEARSLKSRCQQGHTHSETFSRILPCFLLEASGLLAVLGVLWLGWPLLSCGVCLASVSLQGFLTNS